MKRQTILEKLGDFVLGKGFYIVLFLCVATIGISGYYLIRGISGGEEITEPVTGNPTVVLPDSEAGGPDPAGSLTPGLTPDGEETPPADGPEGDQTQSPGLTETADPQPDQSALQTQPEPSAPLVFTWPVNGVILRDFSLETLSLDPTLEDWRTHGGLDIATQLGTNVRAMCAGTVSAVYDDGLMGTTVVIDHGEGLSSVYCNLAGQPTVEEGESVDTGTVIGTVGDTAIAEAGLAPHLHLEVSLNGEPADPAEYLPQR